MTAGSTAANLAPAPERPVVLLRYLDVALLVMFAPVMLLIGVPALGYAVGAGAWIALRAIAEVVERQADRAATASGAVGLRLGFLMSRVFLLAIAVILVRRSDGRDQGLTTLLVVVFAFTVGMVVSFFNRPRRER